MPTISEMVVASSKLLASNKITVELLLPSLRSLQRRIEIEIQPNELFVSGQIDGYQVQQLSGYSGTVLFVERDPTVFRLENVFVLSSNLAVNSKTPISLKPTYSFLEFLKKDTRVDCEFAYYASGDKLFFGAAYYFLLGQLEEEKTAAQAQTLYDSTTKIRYVGLAHKPELTDTSVVSITQLNVYTEYIKFLAQQVQQNEAEALAPYFSAFRDAYRAYGALYKTKISDF